MRTPRSERLVDAAIFAVIAGRAVAAAAVTICVAWCDTAAGFGVGVVGAVWSFVPRLDRRFAVAVEGTLADRLRASVADVSPSHLSATSEAVAPLAALAAARREAAAATIGLPPMSGTLVASVLTLAVSSGAIAIAAWADAGAAERSLAVGNDATERGREPVRSPSVTAVTFGVSISGGRVGEVSPGMNLPSGGRLHVQVRGTSLGGLDAVVTGPGRRRVIPFAVAAEGRATAVIPLEGEGSMTVRIGSVGPVEFRVTPDEPPTLVIGPTRLRLAADVAGGTIDVVAGDDFGLASVETVCHVDVAGLSERTARERRTPVGKSFEGRLPLALPVQLLPGESATVAVVATDEVGRETIHEAVVEIVGPFEGRPMRLAEGLAWVEAGLAELGRRERSARPTRWLLADATALNSAISEAGVGGAAGLAADAFVEAAGRLAATGDSDEALDRTRRSFVCLKAALAAITPGDGQAGTGGASVVPADIPPEGIIREHGGEAVAETNAAGANGSPGGAAAAGRSDVVQSGGERGPVWRPAAPPREEGSAGPRTGRVVVARYGSLVRRYHAADERTTAP